MRLAEPVFAVTVVARRKRDVHVVVVWFPLDLALPLLIRAQFRLDLRLAAACNHA